MSNVRIPGQLAISEGEQPVWYGRQSYASYIGSIIFGFIILAIGILGASFLAFAYPIIPVSFFGFFAFFALLDWGLVYLNVMSTEYFVSNKRIFIKHGIVGRKSHDLKIEWMTGTVVQQGLFGRMLNFGDIVFTGVGFSGDVKMGGVSDVLNVKGIVENVIQSSKEGGLTSPMRTYPTQPQIPAMPSRDTKFCQFCGFKMPSPAVYCPSCGKQQL